MTVKNLYVLMARAVTTDASDNMTSVSQIIDYFNFDIDQEQLVKDGLKLGAQEIALPIDYAVATSWLFGEDLKKETSFKFRINIFDPKGKKLDMVPEQENLVPAGTDKFNMNFNIQGMPVTKEGKYKLQAEILTQEGEALAKASYPYEVVFSIITPQPSEAK